LCVIRVQVPLFLGKGSLGNDYLDNFDNGYSNKYKKLKNRKKSYKYVIILIVWWCSDLCKNAIKFRWFKFNAISLLFDSPSKTLKLKPL
jgi:hypothetical protein